MKLAIIGAARANKTIPVLATLTPTFDSHGYMAGAVDEVNAGIRRLASEERVALVPLDAAFAWDRSLIGPDGLHPNSAGAQVIADTFADVLR